MEAAVANTLSAGDTVLLLRAGKFAERWEEICRAFGVTVVPLSAPFGDTVPAARVRRGAAPAPRSPAPCSCSTASPPPACSMTCRASPPSRATRTAILIVDAVSSLGIADLQMDAWGVDVVVSGSQKGLMLPPGLSFCAVSQKAWGHVRASRLPEVLLRLHRRGASRWRRARRISRPAVSIMLGPPRSPAHARGRRARQCLPAARPSRPRHARRRGGAGARDLRQGHAEPGADAGGGAARASTARRSWRPIPPPTTSPSRAGRAR